MHLQVVKGDLGQWRLGLGAGEYLCRLCGTFEETGDHLGFRCERSSDLQWWVWVSWAQLDNKRRWRYTVEGNGGKIIVWDRVEDFLKDLDEVLMGSVGVRCQGW